MKKSLIICVHERLTASHTSCGLRGGAELANRIERAIARERLDLAVQRFQCLGHCNHGPTMRLVPGGEFLLGVDEQTVMEKVRAFAAQPARRTSDS